METVSHSFFTPIAISAFLFGGLFFWLGWRFLSRGLSIYQSRFTKKMVGDLRSNFLPTDPQIIFFATLCAALLLSLGGFLLAGPVGSVAGLISGLIAPHAIITLLKRRRIERFIYQFPDALMTLATALRAGASLSKGMEHLAQRQPAPLSQEFSLVINEHRVGRDLVETLQNMCQRIPRQELQLFSAAVGISRSVGGNLADTLDSLAKTLSDKTHIESKISALTASGRAQGWVISLLPVAVGGILFKQQPETMRLLFTEIYGWILLAIIACMMALAIYMIRKIVNIDV